MRLKLYSPASRIRDQKQYCIRMAERLQESMEQVLLHRRHTLDLYIERLNGLSPLEKLKSGFSYVEDEQGGNVRSVEGIKVGRKLTIRMRDGQIDAEVTGVRKEQIWQEAKQ